MKRELLEILEVSAELFPPDLIAAAQRHGVIVKRIYRDGLGDWNIQLLRRLDSYSGYFTVTGPAGEPLDLVVNRVTAHLEAQPEGYDIMNLYKTDLFKYITGDMVSAKEQTMTIARVVMETMEGGGGRGSEDKPVIYFQGNKKGAILNKTNAKQLIDAWGPETDAWTGQSVVLFAERGTWFGKTGFALRMRPGSNGAAPKKQKVAKSTEALLDEAFPETAEQEPLFDVPGPDMYEVEAAGG